MKILLQKIIIFKEFKKVQSISYPVSNHRLARKIRNRNNKLLPHLNLEYNSYKTTIKLLQMKKILNNKIKILLIKSIKHQIMMRIYRTVVIIKHLKVKIKNKVNKKS